MELDRWWTVGKLVKTLKVSTFQHGAAGNYREVQQLCTALPCAFGNGHKIFCCEV